MIDQPRHFVIAFYMTILLSASCGRPDVEGDPIVTLITGFVYDADTDDPIFAANVVASPSGVSTTTNQMGRYQIDANFQLGGSYTLTASKNGYVQNQVVLASVEEGSNSVADIFLQPEGPELESSKSTVQINLGSSAGTFQLSNTGDISQSITFNISSPDAWVTEINPTSGSITDTPRTVTVSIDRAELPGDNGNVEGSIDVSSNAGSASLTLMVVR